MAKEEKVHKIDISSLAALFAGGRLIICQKDAPSVEMELVEWEIDGMTVEERLDELRDELENSGVDFDKAGSQ